MLFTQEDLRELVKLFLKQLDNLFASAVDIDDFKAIILADQIYCIYVNISV